MKALLLMLGMGITSFSWGTMGGKLERVEQLTIREQQQVAAARAKVDEAVKEEVEAEQRIAKAHNMKEEQWPEWSTYVSLDGQYILLHRQTMLSK